jgi:hypothetical protein
MVTIFKKPLYIKPGDVIHTSLGSLIVLDDEYEADGKVTFIGQNLGGRRHTVTVHRESFLPIEVPVVAINL